MNIIGSPRNESLVDLIYDIPPDVSSLFGTRNWGRLTLRGMGGSMRKQRRRKAKPLRFTPARHGPVYKQGKLHQWATA